jgi:ABC-type lipoprotein release transport system permease subunit
VIAVAVSGALGSILYGIGARDMIAFAGGTAVVMGIALTASFFPAWKASRTDPLTALRHR